MSHTRATPAPAPSSADLVPARWFDGRSSQAQRVLVGLQRARGGPALVLHPLAPPGAAPRVFRHADIGWPEAWNARCAQSCLTVDLRAQGSLEIDAAAQWHAALAGAGARPGWAQRLQTQWPFFIGAVLLAVAAMALFYRYGTPWAATQLTRQVPLAWEMALARTALAQLDDGTLEPSQLPAARQAQLQARFAALAQQLAPALQRYRGYAPALTLAFRSGMGANAFALPGGTVVLTDGLVKKAAQHPLGDDALIGVLAHEIGHVIHRHTTRMVVEQGVLHMGLGLALGDVSGVLSSGGALLTGLAYRRSHEREADCFAIALMGRAQWPTAPMADLLLAIAHDGATTDKSGKKSGPSAPEDAGTVAKALSLLNSHPDTVKRATQLRQGQAPHCTTP